MVLETADLLKYAWESDTYYVEEGWKATYLYFEDPTKIIVVKFLKRFLNHFYNKNKYLKRYSCQCTPNCFTMH